MADKGKFNVDPTVSLMETAAQCFIVISYDSDSTSEY